MTKNRKENRSRRIFGCLIIDTEFFKKYSSALRCPFFQITLELSAAVLVLLPLVSYGPSKKVLHMLPGRRKEPCCHPAVGASVKNGGCPAHHNNRCLEKLPYVANVLFFPVTGRVLGISIVHFTSSKGRLALKL